MFTDASVLCAWHSLVDKRDPIFQSHFFGTHISILEGPLGIVKAYNGDRIARKRKTRFENPTVDTHRPFDQTDFNFLSLPEEEFLFSGSKFDIVLNPSPVGNGHSLLCPEIPLKHPQYLTPIMVNLATAVSFDPSRRSDFRLLFNSLGAFASVNHLHFHTLWLRDTRFEWDDCIRMNRIVNPDNLTLFPDGEFPIERAAVAFNRAIGGVQIGVTTDSHSRLVRFLHSDPKMSPDISEFSMILSRFIAYLQLQNIPHNVIWCPQGTVYVFPRRFQRNIDVTGDCSDVDGLHIAVVEASGCIICFNESAYEAITDQHSLTEIFDDFVNLSLDNIEQILDQCYG